MTAPKQGSIVRKLFVTLFGLAALGVGVWLFRSKKRRSAGPRA
jgi:hypothetical protein